MKHILNLLTLVALLAGLSASAAGELQWLNFKGKEGPGRGKQVVLIAGDEEYRSEESCPMLAKILSQRHGFDCTVLFSLDPTGSYIDPNNQRSMPGLEALKTADLVIIGTRFRQLSGEQYQLFADYLNAGRPIIGFRTATHAFTGDGQTGDFKWGAFGLNILAEKWVNHHGGHKRQGTRGVIEAAHAKHPVLNGVADVFGPSDVYGVQNLDEKAATVLLRGAVTETLDPASKPVEGAKNNPMQALAWLREYTSPDGKARGRAFCTTMGASVDYTSEDLRRLVVNAAYDLAGLKVPERADVTYVDPFEPTFYGFNNSRDFYRERNLQVSDFVLGKSASLGTGVKKEANAGREEAGRRPVTVQLPIQPEAGETIALIGNMLGERMLHFGYFETRLHQRFPQARLTVRNLCNPGDTPGFRANPSRADPWAFPGADKFHPELKLHFGIGHYQSPDEWLTEVKAGTIIGFFGFNESYDGMEGVERFKAELAAFVDHSRSKTYDGRNPPRVILVTPIAFENRTDAYDLPEGTEENRRLALYSQAVIEVARAKKAGVVDLFSETQKWFGTAGSRWTINGCHLGKAGYEKLAPVLMDAIYGPGPVVSSAEMEGLRAAVVEKDWFWFNDYRMLNGVHVHGQRWKPFGNVNYPEESEKMRQMTRLRDERIWELAAGKRDLLPVADEKTRPLSPIVSNFKRPIEYLDREAALAKFTVREGFKIDLFASEKEFPDLANPVQLTFDNRGRLWVAVLPTYPHYKPGGRMPHDKLLILEDTDGDGRADKQTIFADNLHLPIGFELAPEGVYVSQEPHLCLLVDDDKDDRADRMEVLLSGFDSHDTHHAISAYCSDASGAFYLCEGRFLHSQVETPYGPQRMTDGGVWRFNPKNWRLERYSQADYNNPWGVAFDEWDQGYISDASSGQNYFGLPVSAKVPHGMEIPKVDEFAPKRARPTSGSEFVSSRHFPDELQGHFMINNSIGFLGTSLHDVWEEGAGFYGKVVGDLVSSSDPNFRPVDLEFAPDGSLYIVDWHNALIGHMQHNARDPNRDTTHGRIYRVTYPSRPLVSPAKVAGAGIPELLENLKLPEYRTRYRTRRELRGHPASEVLPAVRRWVAGLDRKGRDYERHLCEALWATWAQNEVDAELLVQCLNAKRHQARAAAVHVLCYNHSKISNSTELFLKAADDPHPRVRLEAAVAASWLDNEDGARIALAVVKHPFDRWMGPVFDMVMKTTLSDDVAALKKSGALDLAGNDRARDYLEGKLTFDTGSKEESYGPTVKLGEDQMKTYNLGKRVFHKDGHCATCHQANGLGMPSAYPPLTPSPWLMDDERLIKLVLHGLWGGMEVNGQVFDPGKGVPPMPGFGGFTDDREIAAVINYVRNSFGNSAPFIEPGMVAQVRGQVKDRDTFYMVPELMKEHPIPGWEKWKRGDTESNIYE